MSIYGDEDSELPQDAGALSIPDYAGVPDESIMSDISAGKRKGPGVCGSAQEFGAGCVERFKGLSPAGKALVVFIAGALSVALLWEGDEAYEAHENAGKRLSGAPVGPRGFVTSHTAMNWDEAKTFCSGMVDGIQLAGLASIHTYEEERQAVEACHHNTLSTTWTGLDIFSDEGRLPHGCWIGLNDIAVEGGFAWLDGSAVDYVNWHSGEPNEYGGASASTSGSYGPGGAGNQGQSISQAGEDNVAMLFVQGHGGAWNDVPNTGACAHNADAVCGMFPVCQSVAAPEVQAGQNVAISWRAMPDVQRGRFVAIAKQMSLFAAEKECKAAGFFGLASIHSLEDVQAASQACGALAGAQHGLGVPHGCWIGLTDRNAEGQYVWSDGTPVDYLNWGPGQPNQYAEGAEQDGVQMDFSGAEAGSSKGGAWSDVHVLGDAGSLASGTSQSDCWGCSGNFGQFPLCQIDRPSCAESVNGPWSFWASKEIKRGSFVVVNQASSWTEAHQYCTEHHAGLASVHRQYDNRQIIEACRQMAGRVAGVPYGCWIGMHDNPAFGATPGTFQWSDGSPVNYVNFLPNEPNNWGVDTAVGTGSFQGENSVSLDTRNTRAGGWNDAHHDGAAGHGSSGGVTGHDTMCFGCSGVYGMYPVCQTKEPDLATWQSASSTIVPPTQWLAPTATARQAGIADQASPNPVKFMVWPVPMSWEDARTFCHSMGAVLASIHSYAEQQDAAALCGRVAGKIDGQPSACWIGMGDHTNEGEFNWGDHTPVDFLYWKSDPMGGEPSNYNGGGRARTEGEDGVALEMKDDWGGAWNDQHTSGRAGQGADACGCYGCYGAYGNYPMCMPAPPPPCTSVAPSPPAPCTPAPTPGLQPPPRVCIIPQTLRGCQGIFNECCEPVSSIPPIAGCEAVSETSADSTVVLSLQAACPGSYGDQLWFSLTNDGMRLNVSMLQRHEYTPAYGGFHAEPASYRFNQQVLLLPMDIGPIGFPDLTIELWFKMNEVRGTGSRAAARGWIIGHAPIPGHADRGLSAAESRGIAIDDISYGGIAAPGGSVYVSTLGYPVYNEWYHIVAVFQHGQQSPVVLNGGGVVAGGSPNGMTDYRMVNSKEGDPELAIGGLQNYAGFQVDADIAMVRIYSRAFTVPEAAQRYEASCFLYKGAQCVDQGR